jgi:methionine salvage enolase-phosphatase E1
MVVTKNRPNAIILDVEGVVFTKEFEMLSETKKKFYRSKINSFINNPSHWEKSKDGPSTDGLLKLVYRSARNAQHIRSLKEGEPTLPKHPSRDEMQNALKRYILFCLQNNSMDGPSITFLEMMQYWGYKNSLIKTPVYPDVFSTLREWTSDKKIMTYLNMGSNRNFERLTYQTDKGNLRQFFTGKIGGRHVGHFKLGWNSDVDPIADLGIKDKKSVLFITHSAKEARAALKVGLDVVMIARSDIDPDWKARIQRMQEDNSDDISSTGTGPIMIQTNEGLAPEDMITSECPEFDKKETEGLREIKEETVDSLFTVNSIITLQDTKIFPVIESLKDLQFP